MSGAGVLAAEMLGTRLIGPFYGAGLYLWSALIVVALSALSLGYWLGGRAVDRNPSTAIFCALPGAAGLWIALIPWLLDPALSATGWMGLRGAVLVSSFIMFFPPLVLLGMVTPFAVRAQDGRDGGGRPKSRRDLRPFHGRERRRRDRIGLHSHPRAGGAASLFLRESPSSSQPSSVPLS